MPKKLSLPVQPSPGAHKPEVVPVSALKKQRSTLFARIAKLPFTLKIVGALIIVFALWFGWSRLQAGKAGQPTYQTAQAATGDLVVSVTGSGSVTATNNVTVSTQATGVVTKVYVKDGDTVKAGQKLADLELDTNGQQNYASALASYEGAKNALASAQNALYTSQSSMLSKWNSYYSLATNSYYQDSSGAPQHRTEQPIVQAQDDWLAAEAAYKQQQQTIAQAQTSLSSSYLSYLQHTPSIYAPISGTISGFSLQNGTVVNATTSTSGSSLATKIASVVTGAKPSIVITLTEVDITKVKAGDKATITADSQPDKTFTGRVVSVDTVGSVSSGVTSYSVYLSLDTDEPDLYPNMSATANIITKVDNNVLTVPSSAVTTANGVSTVQVMKNGAPQTVTVQTGDSSDTDTVITSGLSAGDTVVTATIQPTTSSTSSSQQSVFSSFGGRTGGATRVLSR